MREDNEMRKDNKSERVMINCERNAKFISSNRR